MKYRTESDTLGSMKVPADAVYGAQTARAVQNFPISGMCIFPAFIRTSAQIKEAAAIANMQAKSLDRTRGNAIIAAAKEVASGKWDDQFVVDVFQAGAGTSHHMNVNEVIALRASKIAKQKVDSHDHVNASQSTNDFYPTAMRLCAYQELAALRIVLKDLAVTFQRKAKQFARVQKAGRTHLQDAVPMTVGAELGGYSACLAHHAESIAAAQRELVAVGFGGTAVGTGLNAPKAYQAAVIGALKKTTGVPVRAAADKYFAMWGMTPFVHVSGALKNLALDLMKISADIRLLSSGPHTGLSELNLPAVQPGSSIMPGKVNPSIAECLSMICCQIVGNDTTIAVASQAGQLQLNVMMPVINYNLLQSIMILTNGMTVFADKCISDITVNTNITAYYANATAALATVLNPIIGYDKAAAVVQASLTSGKSVKDIVIQQKLLTEKEWNTLIGQ